MTQTTTIPQPVLDTYNAHYNNQTYTAFSTALATALGLDERVAQLEMYDERHNRIMNLFIDAAMELVGSEYHARAGQRLGEALGALDGHTPWLVRLAVEHLNHFVSDKRPWEVHEQIASMATLALAEAARRALVRALDYAALLPGWRGTTAYYWLLASTQIIHSAEIVLREDPDADYLVEKFGKGIDGLGMGLGEIVRYGHPHPAIRRFCERLTMPEAEGGHD
jgi:tetrahydromethanopterin S-methyltransferase subunit G